MLPNNNHTLLSTLFDISTIVNDKTPRKLFPVGPIIYFALGRSKLLAINRFIALNALYAINLYTQINAFFFYKKTLFGIDSL